MNFEEFTFIRPWILTLIPVALVVLWSLYKINHHKSQLSNLIDPLLVNFIQDKKSFKFSKLIYWFACSFILLAIVAAAGPSLQKTKIETYNAGTPLIIILDTSLSMNSTDLKPTRIQRAKFKILDIINSKKDSLVGLIAYSGSAHTIVPLSYDFDILENLLLDLNPETMPYFGNDLDSAFKKAIKLLENVGYAKADVLLIVDEIHPVFSKQAKDIIKDNSKINTIIYAVGKKNTQSPILYQNKLLKRNSDQKLILLDFNFESIKNFADDTGANLILFDSSSSDVELIIDNLTDVESSNPSSKNEDIIEIKHDSGYWLLIVILILLLPLFRRGNYWLIFGLIFSSHFMPQTQTLKAQSILEYFMDDDSVGKYYYDKQEYQKATEKFEDKSWKGLSYIKNKNYQNAIEELEKSEKIYDWYNQANAYAYVQDFKNSLDLYQKIITKSEELILNESIENKKKTELREVLDRAKFNKNYIEKFIAKNEQQEQEKQQKQQKEEEQEQEENQENSEQQSEQKKQNQQQEKQESSEQQAQNNQDNQKQSSSQNSEQDKNKSEKNEKSEKDKTDSQVEQEQNEKKTSQSENAENKENEKNKESQKQRFDEQSKDLEDREENQQAEQESENQPLIEKKDQEEKNQEQQNENVQIQVAPKELTEEQKKQKSLQKIKAKLKDIEFSTQNYLKRKLEYELNEQNKKGEVRKNQGIQL